MTLGTKIGCGVLALSAALVGAMVWVSRKSSGGFKGLERPKRKGFSYDDAKDLAPMTIQEEDRDGYQHKAPHPAPRKPSSKVACKLVKPLANTSANTQVLACQGGGEKPRMQSARDVYEFLKGQGNLLQEEFVVLALDHRNNLVAATVVSRGSATSVQATMLDTFRSNVIYGASRAILAHNHPSGSTEPSGSDVALTERAIRTGKELGVNILDHIIIGKDDYASLRDTGMVEF